MPTKNIKIKNDSYIQVVPSIVEYLGGNGNYAIVFGFIKSFCEHNAKQDKLLAFASIEPEVYKELKKEDYMFISAKGLAEHSGLSQRTVERSLEVLKKKGLIGSEQIFAYKRDMTNFYFITDKAYEIMQLSIDRKVRKHTEAIMTIFKPENKRRKNDRKKR
jgi:DNA-binding MarR family transcriptional regulator